MSRYRKSLSLAQLKSDLRAWALKTDDEEMANLFWSWYYKVRNAEQEVNALVQEAEIRRLIEIAVQHGLVQQAIDDDKANPAQSDDEQSEVPESTYIKRNLPKQKRLL